MNHTCYMEGGSIYNAVTGRIIECPAILVSKQNDMIHGWGNLSDVAARFDTYIRKYTQAGMADKLNDMTLIELSEYKITREMACYVIRRATEFTATGFITNLCDALTNNPDPIAWLRSEMERIPIDVNEKEWGRKTW